jgi:ATP/maltotriose-dependent transcriptional regulator MalT
VAIQSLLRDLALGEPKGYRRIYLVEDLRLAEHLRQCQASQEESGGHFPSLPFIDSLLVTIQDKKSGRQADQKPLEGPAASTITNIDDGLPVSLSAREMEVLVLIADGKSNQKNPTELYLALSTVKRHSQNNYTKLDVRKRTHAISRARHLGLNP